MISYNKDGFVKDGKSWFPVMGEYQYSRSDARYWAEGMAKMKALGVDVVASYSFWIHHEEIESHYNFRGNNNLRKFVRTVKESGMLMCLRIGPWVHGEARNGGFPDWIYNKGYRLRSNDAGYMRAVRRYFEQLYAQCNGYLYEQGGPIFAIQVENEYSQWGRQGKDIGDEHINALIAMLKEIGFNVPVYFATGWGQAATGAAVPVWGAYCEAPWENSDAELAPMPGYLFSYNPNDENIGSDTGKKKGVTDVRDMPFPYLTVELGSGVQVTKIRRPIVRGDDVAAMALCKLGSGVRALGYYVFHGGMQPTGALSTMQEQFEPGRNEGGFNCDLPVINYDFQAAISQYGQITSVGKHIKLCNRLACFLGRRIAGARAYLPADNAVDAEDFVNPRYALCESGEGGYLFFNNYVRHYVQPDREIEWSCGNGSGRLSVKSGQYGCYPFRLPVKGGVIESIEATPLCVLNDTHYVFWSDTGVAALSATGDIADKIVLLNKAQALDSYIFRYRKKDRLFITDAQMYEDDDGIHAEYGRNGKDVVVKVFPDVDLGGGWNKCASDGMWGTYVKKAEKCVTRAKITPLGGNDGHLDYKIEVIGQYKGKNTFLYIDYRGDKIEVFIDGELVADHFYTGIPYEMCLRNYEFAHCLTVRVYAMRKSDFVYIEKPPVFTDGLACELTGVRVLRQDEEIIR